QATASAFEPPVEAPQRFVDTSAHTPRDDAEQASSPVAAALLVASTLAALTATRCQPKPGGKLFLALPVFAQVCPDLSQELQQDITRHSRQDGRVFLTAQSPQQRMKSGDLGRVNSTSLGGRRSWVGRIFGPGHLLQHLFNGLVAFADLLLVELPQLVS